MKVGVLGGTFDPVHSGHLFLAREARQLFDLERVLFIISRNPPHKFGGQVSDAFHRYAMLCLALRDEEAFFVSRLELMRPGPSYTVDTLRQLQEGMPVAEFCFIAGSDSLNEVHLWKECGSLFLEHCLVFVQRPGAKVDLEKLTLKARYRDRISLVGEEGSPEIRAGRSFLVDLDPPPISSTELRQQIRLGLMPDARFISPDVLKYAKKYHLYDRDQAGLEESL